MNFSRGISSNYELIWPRGVAVFEAVHHAPYVRNSMTAFAVYPALYWFNSNTRSRLAREDHYIMTPPTLPLSILQNLLDILSINMSNLSTFKNILGSYYPCIYTTIYLHKCLYDLHIYAYSVLYVFHFYAEFKFK